MKLQPNPNPFSYRLGDRGEIAAAEYLKKNGYKIIQKNYQCKIGEIDLIVEKKKRLSFVEIKTRTSNAFGRPEESVHAAKQKKLIRLAQWYLKENPKISAPVDFHVVAIIWDPERDTSPLIRHIPQAFTLPDDDIQE